MEKLFYRPEKAVLGDMIPFYDHGEFKPFICVTTVATGMRRIVTVGLCLPPRIMSISPSMTRTSLAARALCCWWMECTICSTAPSSSPLTATISNMRPVRTWISGQPLLRTVFARMTISTLLCTGAIPLCFGVEEEKCWWMILAAQKKGLTTRRGCVGLCKSTDLHHWTYCEPLYAP